MEYVNEIWRTELYKLQQQAPKARPVRCKRLLLFIPKYYGAEYHGFVSKEDVEKIMESQTSGSYLIKDGIRTVGTYTLVIKFDNSLKNYKLYYDLNNGQHYVGNKFFDKMKDLVQDGLIHFYIETRGAAELKKIAECNMYQESPFYKSRYYTLQMTRRKLECDNQDDCQSNIGNNIGNANDFRSYDKLNKIKNTMNQSIDADLQCISDSKDKSKISKLSNLNSGELTGRVEYPSIRHKPFTDSSLGTEESQNKISNKTLSAFQSIQGHDQDLIVDKVNCDINRHTYEPYSSPIDTIVETKYSVYRDSKSEILSPLWKSSVNPYTNSFSVQEKCHNFKIHTFKGPSWCDFCTHFMWGLVSQGVKCQDCGLQAHKKCSDRVPSDCLPVMNRKKRVFSIELTILCKVENRDVPMLLVRLITILEDRGLELEGIYRISGNSEAVEAIMSELDNDIESVDLETDERLSELHNVSGLIKLFFRQLPIPLVTLEISSMLTDLYKSEDNQEVRLKQMGDCLLRLPLVHYATLKFFMEHLRKISVCSDINKMNVQNLAIIFAPSLIGHKAISMPVTAFLTPFEVQEIIYKTLQSNVVIIEDLIQYNYLLFAEERQL